MDRARWHLIGNVLVATIVALAASPAVAQSQQQIDQCTNKGGSFTSEVRINACTSLIQSDRSGKSLPQYYYQRCRAYIKKGDYDSALRDCNEAIRLDPKYAVAYDSRGNVYDYKKDYDRAIADYGEAIRLDPKDAGAFNNRGNAYADKGDPDRAIPDYDEAIRLDPKDAAAFRNRGMTYRDKGDLDRAIVDYDEAIRLDPKYADAFNSRCWARALAGRDLAAALADCNESLRLDPGAAAFFNTRGLVQLKLGAFDRAIADYGAAIAKRPKDANSLYGRGVAKLKSGDRAGGEADLAAAKTIEADIAQVYAGYGVK